MSEPEKSTGETVKVAPRLLGQPPLTREQLYELVWREPMLRIGERLESRPVTWRASALNCECRGPRAATGLSVNSERRCPRNRRFLLRGLVT